MALRTTDLRATRRFYTGILGLRVAFPHRGMLFLETPGGDDLLNFVATRKRFDPSAGGLDHFGLHFERGAWQEVRERLREAGVRVTGRRGRSAVYVRDPNGYTVELYVD